MAAWSSASLEPWFFPLPLPLPLPYSGACTIPDAWNNPADIKQWNSAQDDWHTTRSSVDLREGGQFLSRMEAKDGSVGFDFEGTYTRARGC